MGASTVIEIDGVSKLYRLGTIGGRTLREDVARWWELARGRPDPLLEIGADRSNVVGDTLWALRDINLSVSEGEILGIIGKNGAGKSTLLKLLSRITAPTSGEIRMRGRTGSLLEVGTGFHPELTGRENVYLNGSILGMGRSEIDRKFDEIVDFSGVGRFIDTPVKRYSSGMHVRLGFAVAAHLEPEILIIDEVLAVGDAGFQSRCLSKLGSVAREGRTVLFVSHNLGSIRRLCERAVLLEEGRVIVDGEPTAVVARYLESATAEGISEKSWNCEDAPGDAAGRLRRVRICQPPGRATGRVDMESAFSIEIYYEVESAAEEFNLSVILTDASEQVILHTALNTSISERFIASREGRFRCECTIPAHALNAGTYWVSVGADIPFRRMVWEERRVVRMDIAMTSGQMGRYADGAYQGLLGPQIAKWTRTSVEEGDSAIRQVPGGHGC